MSRFQAHRLARWVWKKNLSHQTTTFGSMWIMLYYVCVVCALCACRSLFRSSSSTKVCLFVFFSFLCFNTNAFFRLFAQAHIFAFETQENSLKLLQVFADSVQKKVIQTLWEKRMSRQIGSTNNSKKRAKSQLKQKTKSDKKWARRHSH